MRSAVAQAKNAYDQSNSTAGSAGQNAGQVRGSLVPGLERDANNPTGYTPEEMNNQLVAGEQGLGGATSSLKGEADLGVARSRNTAGYSNAMDEAAREKMRTSSQNALGVQNESAKLAQQKQQASRSQLGQIYGMDVDEMMKAQGLLPEDVNAEVNASKSGWLQNTMGMISTLSGAAGGIKKMFPGLGGS